MIVKAADERMNLHTPLRQSEHPGMATLAVLVALTAGALLTACGGGAGS